MTDRVGLNEATLTARAGNVNAEGLGLAQSRPVTNGAAAAEVTPPPTGSSVIGSGETMYFDINKDGVVDFVSHVLFEAKFAVIPGLCQ